MSKKILALVLALVMVCSLCLTPVLAASDAPSKTFPDAEDNWAESSINRWGAAGIVQGDANGNFNPGNYLSRAELATILVRLLGLSETAAADTFSDVAANAWYADAVLKNAAAKIMLGDGAGKAMPEQNVTREQAITMIGRALGVKGGAAADLAKFNDAAQVADWSESFAAAFAALGILNGVEDGSRIAPQLPIDRASAMALLDKAIASYITAPGDYTVNAEDKFVVVNVSDGGTVTLRGAAAGILVTPGNAANLALKGVTADTLKIDAPVEVTLDSKTSIDAVTVSAGAAKNGKTPVIKNSGSINTLIANDDLTLTGNKPANTIKADGVTVSGSTSSSGSSGGSGGSSVTTKYDVTVKTAGSAADQISVGLKGLTAADGVYSVAKDAEVEVVVTVAEGADVVYTVSVDAEAVELTGNTFTMPAQAVTVTVTAEFKTAEADKTALAAAIAAAETAAQDVAVSADGKDVAPAAKWVTAAEKQALDDAVAAAKAVAEKADATQAEVDAAAAALNDAVKTFEAAQKAGLKEDEPTPAEVDKTALTKALTDAAAAKQDVTVNEGSESEVDRGVKFVNQAAMDALDAAIAAAQAVADKADATQAEVDAAAADLTAATATFNAAVKTGTKTDTPVTPADETYTVTLDVKSDYVVAGLTGADVTDNGDGTYTVKADAEATLVYSVTDDAYIVSVDTSVTLVDNKFTVTGDVTITLTAEKKTVEPEPAPEPEPEPEQPADETYTVTLDADANVIAALTGADVTDNGDGTYTVKADAVLTLVYSVANDADLYTVSADVNGVPIASGETFTVTADATVTVTAARKPVLTVVNNTAATVAIQGDVYMISADVYAIAADAQITVVVNDGAGVYTITSDVTTLDIQDNKFLMPAQDVTLTVADKKSEDAA